METAKIIEELDEVARDLWNAGKLNAQARTLERIAEALATQPAEQASAGSIDTPEFRSLFMAAHEAETRLAAVAGTANQYLVFEEASKARQALIAHINASRGARPAANKELPKAAPDMTAAGLRNLRDQLNENMNWKIDSRAFAAAPLAPSDTQGAGQLSMESERNGYWAHITDADDLAALAQQAPDAVRDAVQVDAKEIAISVAHEVLQHIDAMYPAMWKPVAKNARLSIRNTIINQSQRYIAALNKDRCIGAARWEYIEDNASTDGGGKGFEIKCWVPVDHEDMGCGVDAAIALKSTAPKLAEAGKGE